MGTVQEWKTVLVDLFQHYFAFSYLESRVRINICLLEFSQTNFFDSEDRSLWKRMKAVHKANSKADNLDNLASISPQVSVNVYAPRL